MLCLLSLSRLPEEDSYLSKPLYLLSLRSLSSICEYVFLVPVHFFCVLVTFLGGGEVFILSRSRHQENLVLCSK